MASKSAILAVRIVGDAADALKAFDQAESRAKGFQDGLDKASVGAGIALTAIAGFGTVAVNAASEAEQAFGAVDSVFGDTADAVHAFADEASQAVGLSTQSYEQLASVFGAQLSNMGIAGGELAGTTDELIGLGADLAATFGGSTADAVGALSSLLRGERDPIEQFGVSIKQADIEAQKAAMGLDGLTGEAERNADMQATLALLYDQTASAQGQFGREAETAAGQVQRMEAEFANTVAQLGEQLLPLLSTGAEVLSEFAQWVQENQELVTGLAIAVAAIAASILVLNGAMKAYAAIQAIVKIATLAGAAAQGVATAAQWAFNIAASANPVVLIVLAIIAVIALVVAAIIWLWQNWDEVTAWIAAAWEATTTWLGEAFDNVIAWIVGAWEAATAWIANAWQQYAVDPVIRAWDLVKTGFQIVVDKVREIWNTAIDWIKTRWQAGVDMVIDAWDSVGDGFQAVGDWIRGVIDDIIGGIQNMIGWIQDGINGFLDLIGFGNQASNASPAQAAIAPPPIPNAPIWATMAATGGLLQAAMAARAAPAASSYNVAAQPRSASRATVINITVNGALDKTGTAREIRRLLERYDVVTGRA